LDPEIQPDVTPLLMSMDLRSTTWPALLASVRSCEAFDCSNVCNVAYIATCSDALDEQEVPVDNEGEDLVIRI
jgi:hypothetical protein